MTINPKTSNAYTDNQNIYIFNGFPITNYIKTIDGYTKTITNCTIQQLVERITSKPECEKLDIKRVKHIKHRQTRFRQTPLIDEQLKCNLEVVGEQLKYNNTKNIGIFYNNLPNNIELQITIKVQLKYIQIGKISGGQ